MLFASSSLIFYLLARFAPHMFTAVCLTLGFVGVGVMVHLWRQAKREEAELRDHRARLLDQHPSLKSFFDALDNRKP